MALAVIWTKVLFLGQTMRIESEEEYEAALREIAGLLQLTDTEVDPATEEELARLETLVDAIGAWEDEHHPIEPPPLEASILFHQDRVLGYSNHLIAVVEEHPECSWSVRQPTEEELSSHEGYKPLEFVLDMEGINLYATKPEIEEFFEWLVH